MNCTVKPGDEFAAFFHRPLQDGGELRVAMQIEHYHGPAKYSDATIFVGMQKGELLYWWNNEYAPVVVNRGEQSAVIPEAKLQAQAGTPASGQGVRGKVVCKPR